MLKYDAFVEAVNEHIEAAFVAAGAMMVDQIQKDVPVADGRLRDSITFGTAKSSPKRVGNAKGEDMIPLVTEPYTLYVGTMCPYGPAIEHGATPGTGRGAMDNHGTMRSRIEAWLVSTGQSSSYDDVSRVISNIIARGARATPFFRHNRERCQQIADTFMQKAVSDIAKTVALGNQKTVIELTIPISMS